MYCPLVGCGLRSHSAIFQLYSDGTVVQFPSFDLLPGTQRHGQLGVFSVPSLPRHGHRDVRRRLKRLCHQRARMRWGYAGNRTRNFRSKVQPATSMPPRRAVLFVMENDAYLWTILYSHHCFFWNFVFYSRKANLAHQYKKWCTTHGHIE